MKRLLRALCPCAALILAPPVLADGRACELVTPEQIHAVIGAKPSLKPEVLPTGVETCTGKAGAWTVKARLFKKGTEAEAEKEKEELERLRKAGATVDGRKFAGVECHEVRPGGSAARHPYATSCAVARKSTSAVLEVSHPSQSVEMRKLSPVAGQMASHFWEVAQ